MAERESLDGLHGIDGPRVLAAAGALCALGSLAFPYATLVGFGQRVPVTPRIRGRLVLLGLAALVVGGAAIALVEYTRGEQVLGVLFALLLATTVVGPLFVPELTGVPEAGLWLLFVGWLLVDAADNLDPRLSNERAERWVALAALAVLGTAGSVFLWLHRQYIEVGLTGPAEILLPASGAIAIAAWLVAFWWEWTATREAAGS
jgi:hypothetical protein